MKDSKMKSQNFRINCIFEDKGNRYLALAIESFAKQKLKEKLGFDIRYIEVYIDFKRSPFCKPRFVKKSDLEYGLFVEFEIRYFAAEALLTVKIFENEFIGSSLKENKNNNSFFLIEYFRFDFNENTKFEIDGKINITEENLEKFRDPYILKGLNMWNSSIPKIYYYPEDIKSEEVNLHGIIVFYLKEGIFVNGIIDMSKERAKMISNQRAYKIKFNKFETILNNLEEKKLIIEYHATNFPGFSYLSLILVMVIEKFGSDIEIVYLADIEKKDRYMKYVLD